MNITIYKTPTCATCGVAAKRLTASGVNAETIDLTEEPGVLSELKVRLEVGPAQMIQVPIFEDAEGKLYNITDLPDLLKRASV